MTGRRNLLILGGGAILAAVLTTGIELWVYRSSGDIYLDRSRPGYLPDSDEAAKEEPRPNAGYKYSDSGALDKAELKEYVEKLKEIEAYLKKIGQPFAAGPLSDETLGLKAPEAKETDK